jgi:hypothetical protein
MALARTLTRGGGERFVSKEIRQVKIPQKGLKQSTNFDAVNTTVAGSSITRIRINSHDYPAMLTNWTTLTPNTFNYLKGSRSRGAGISAVNSIVTQRSSSARGGDTVFTSTIASINVNIGTLPMTLGIIGSGLFLARGQSFPNAYLQYDGFNGSNLDSVAFPQLESTKNIGLYEVRNTKKSNSFFQSDAILYGIGGAVNGGHLRLDAVRATYSNSVVFGQIRLSTPYELLQTANYAHIDSLTSQNARFVMNLQKIKINNYIPRN